MQISLLNFQNRINYSNNSNNIQISPIKQTNCDTVSFSAKRKIDKQQYDYKYLCQKYNFGIVDDKQILNAINEKYRELRGIGEYNPRYEMLCDNWTNSEHIFFNRTVENPLRFDDLDLVFERSRIMRFNTKKPFDDVSQILSLNVHPNRRLVKALDEFMMTGKFLDENGNIKRAELFPQKFYYQVPNNGPEAWYNRQNPVKLYFEKDVSKKTLDAIAQITQRFSRGTIAGNSSKGKYNWLSIDNVPTMDEICNLQNRAKKIGNNAYKAISSRSTSAYTSPATYKAASLVLDELECLKAYL